MLVGHETHGRAKDVARGSGLLARVWRARLFVLLALTFAWFYEGGDPNQATRMFLTRAVVERHEPDITPYHAKTIDKSQEGDKFYCDKAPAVSLLATIPYALTNAVDRRMGWQDLRAAHQARLHLITFLFSGIPGVVAAFFVRRSLRFFGAGEGASDLLTVGYALGTLVFPFSTVLFGHQLAAALLAASFWYAIDARTTGALTPSRLALLGALWGTALTTEYPTGLLVAVQGLYVLWAAKDVKGGLRVLAWSAVGAATPLVLHSAFLMWAFGSPISLPYAHMAEPIFLAHVSTGILGINLPTWVGFFGSFFSRYRGLFFLCPVLVLSLLGFRSWILAGEKRAELVLCGAQVVLYSSFCAGYYAWDGGGSTGPRHIVPALAFFLVPAAYFVRSKKAAVIAAVAVVPSVLLMLACVAVRIQVPEGDPWRANPLYEIVLPAFLRGELAINRADLDFVDPRGDAAHNLGMLVGLNGLASLLPLALAWLLVEGAALLPRRRTA